MPARLMAEVNDEFADYWAGRRDAKAKRTPRGWQGTWKNRMRAMEDDPRTLLGRYLKSVGWTPPEMRGRRERDGDDPFPGAI